MAFLAYSILMDYTSYTTTLKSPYSSMGGVGVVMCVVFPLLKYKYIIDII